MGSLSRPTAPWPAADLSRVPAVDCANGARESGLGLLPNPRRALEAGPPSRGDHDPLGTARRRGSAFRPAISADLEAIPERACRVPRRRRFLQCGHHLLQAALRPYLCASASRRVLLASCTSEPNA